MDWPWPNVAEAIQIYGRPDLDGLVHFQLLARKVRLPIGLPRQSTEPLPQEISCRQPRSTSSQPKRPHLCHLCQIKMPDPASFSLLQNLKIHRRVKRLPDSVAVLHSSLVVADRRIRSGFASESLTGSNHLLPVR